MTGKQPHRPRTKEEIFCIWRYLISKFKRMAASVRRITGQLYYIALEYRPYQKEGSLPTGQFSGATLASGRVSFPIPSCGLLWNSVSIRKIIPQVTDPPHREIGLKWGLQSHHKPQKMILNQNTGNWCFLFGMESRSSTTKNKPGLEIRRISTVLRGDRLA